MVLIKVHILVIPMGSHGLHLLLHALKIYKLLVKILLLLLLLLRVLKICKLLVQMFLLLLLLLLVLKIYKLLVKM